MSQSFKNKSEFPSKYILLFILMFGAVLRITFLGSYPSGINQDELSNIYDAYSIAQTGTDRSNTPYFMVARAFGDYRPALYNYLAAPFIKIGGFSIQNGRMLSGILGTLLIYLLYLFSKKIFNRENLALFIAFLVTISPWHVIYSRIAHEGAIISPLIFGLGIYYWFLLRGKNNSKWFHFLFLGGLIGILGNVYHGTKITSCALAILICLSFLHEKKISGLKSVILFSVGWIICMAPQIHFTFFHTTESLVRSNSELITPTFSFEYISTVLNNCYQNLSPHFLFTGSGMYRDLTISRFLLTTGPFFYLGIIILIVRTKTIPNHHLISLLIISILPAIITNGSPHALRSSCLLFIAPIIIGYGIYWLNEQFPKIKLQVLLGLSIVLSINFALELKLYFSHNVYHSAGFQPDAILISKKIGELQVNYNEVIIEQMRNQLHLYVVAANNISPEEFKNSEFNRAPVAGYDVVKKQRKYQYVEKYEITNWISRGNCDMVKPLFVSRFKPAETQLIDSLHVRFHDDDYPIHTQWDWVYFSGCK